MRYLQLYTTRQFSDGFDKVNPVFVILVFPVFRGNVEVRLLIKLIFSVVRSLDFRQDFGYKPNFPTVYSGVQCCHAKLGLFNFPQVSRMLDIPFLENLCKDSKL